VGGTTSRIDLSTGTDGGSLAWGAANAQYQCMYYYWVTYFGIEMAFAEASPILVTWGDGFYYGDAGIQAVDDRLERNMVLWALSSGARGVSTGSDAIWQWPSTAPAAVTAENWFANVAGKVRALIESLTDWHKLLPDTSNLLVTAGRGTRASYSNQFYLGNTDAYVTASRTPSGSLAIIYLSHPTTITIDQTKMAAGYGAKWYDPASLAVQSATPGATYNSTALGNNSAGDQDWLLVLSVPPYATWTVP
jgi:hypothetical protein